MATLRPGCVCVHLALVLLLCPTFSPAGFNDGYVGCTDSDDCVAFDVSTYSVYDPIDLIPEGQNPGDATMKPDGSEVWICGGTGDGIVIIDVATNTVIYRLDMGDYPTSICFTDDARLALISSRNDNIVTLVDTRTYRITGSLHVSAGGGGQYDGPGQLALDPASRKIYAVDWYGPTIYEIARDASEVVRHAQVGVNLWQLVCDPLGRYIYVTDRGTDQVRVIDQQTLTQITAIDVSDNPMGIDVTRDATKLVVSCEDHSNAFIISTLDWSTHALPLQLNADPRDVDILDSEKRAFIAGGKLQTGDETYVYVLNLETNQLVWQFQLTGADASVIAVQGQMPLQSRDDDPLRLARGGRHARHGLRASGPPCRRARGWVGRGRRASSAMGWAGFGRATGGNRRLSPPALDGSGDGDGEGGASEVGAVGGSASMTLAVDDPECR